MKTNEDSFFAEPVDPQLEARACALEVICWLFICMTNQDDLTPLLPATSQPPAKVVTRCVVANPEW